MCLAPQFKQLLDNGAGEREVHTWLKQHPRLMLNAFWGASNLTECFSEFHLGEQWRADFLLVFGFSGGYEIKLIELESPDTPLYNADGTEAKSLRLARKQISDWKAFVDTHTSYFLDGVARLLEPRKKPDAAHYCAYAHDGIRHHASYIRYYYHVVIGRRESLRPDDLGRKARGTNDFQIRTYDHLLDQALRDDATAAEVRRSFATSRFNPPSWCAK